jgi:hypothetical protein
MGHVVDLKEKLALIRRWRAKDLQNCVFFEVQKEAFNLNLKNLETTTLEPIGLCLSKCFLEKFSGNRFWIKLSSYPVSRALV